MKQRLYFLCIGFLTCCLARPALAQQYAFTVASPTANTIPFASGATSNFRQWIYYPANFPAAPSGDITDIYIKASAPVTPSFTNLTVKMGTTALNTFPNTNYITGLQTVYSGPYSQATVAGNYVRITLQTPFTYDNTQNFVVEVSQTGNAPGFNVNQATTGVAGRSVFGAAANTSGSIQDRLADFGFDIIPGGSGFNNAGVPEHTAPLSHFCPGTSQVKVKVKNYGTNILNTLQVQWRMNGVLQTPVNITTPIDTAGSPGGNELEVTLGNYTFTTAPVQLKAWTTLPNGGVDTINTNDTLTVTLAPTNFTVNATPDTVCANTPASLALSPGTGFSPANVISWESSTNGTTWTTIPGANTPNYAATGLSTQTYFRAKVTTGATGVCTSGIDTVDVFNLTLPTGIGAERCGAGPVTLSATVAGAGVLKWYENPAGGPPVGTGATFTTPSLTTTTDYYVTAGDGNSADSVAVPLSSGTTTGVYHHMFLVASTTGTTISDIALKVNNAAGALTAWDIYYRPNNYQLVPGANTSNSGWTLLASTTNVVSLGATNYTTIASNLGLAIPPGATYSLYIAPVTGTHQYASSAIGTVTATSPSLEIKAGNRGSSLFNCTTSGGQAVVKIKTLAGCESPRVPVTATINEVPAPNLGTDLDTCTFNAIPMTLDPGPQPAGSTYIWDNNTTGTQHHINTSGTYHVRVTTPQGCVNSDTVVILMREKPAIDLAANGTSFCNGATKILDAGPGGQNGGTYYWSNGAQTQTIEVADAGTYIVFVTSADGCANSDTVTVTVDGYAPTTDGINAVALSTNTFSFSAINPQHIVTYEWDFGDGQVSTDPNPSHTYTASGNYLVRLRSFSTCADLSDSAYVNIIGVGIKEATALKQLAIYPNPNDNGLLYINTGSDIHIEKISLINVLGQMVITESQFAKGQKIHQIDLPQQLPGGIYSLRIETDKGITTRKVEIRK